MPAKKNQTHNKPKKPTGESPPAKKPEEKDTQKTGDEKKPTEETKPKATEKEDKKKNEEQPKKKVEEPAKRKVEEVKKRTPEEAGQRKSGRRKWTFDDMSTRRYAVVAHDAPPPEGWLSGGFLTSDDRRKVNPGEHEAKLRTQAMQVATAPGKTLMMTCFMLWLSGGLHIFSIMTLCMALWGPLSKIANIQKEFARYTESKVDVTLAKLIFILLNFVGIGAALYKASTLGLLPTATDWVSTAIKPALEFSSGSTL